MPDFEKLTNFPSVAKALADLSRLTSTPVVFKDFAELRRDLPDQRVPTHITTGATIAMNGEIRIYVGDKRAEFTAVHELLHQLLSAEKFPEVQYRDAELEGETEQELQEIDQAAYSLRNNFQNVLEHPEIYRRMGENYGLAMGGYLDQIGLEHVDRLKRVFARGPAAYDPQRMYDILQELECFLIGEHAAKARQQFKRSCWQAFSACFRLFNSIRIIGFTTPVAMQKAAETIRDQIIDYGKANEIQGPLPRLWEYLTFRIRS